MKKIIALLLVLVMVLGLVACGAKEAPKTEEKKEETSAPAQTEEKKEEPKKEEPKTEEKKDPPVLGVVLRDATSQTFITQSNAMKEQCDKYGITMHVADAKGDLATQITCVENFIAMDVDYIWLTIFDVEGIKDALQKAKDAGITLLIHDSIMDEADMDFGVVDNYDYGYAVGKMAAEYINNTPELKNAEVVEWGLETYHVTPSLIPRHEGVQAAMEELCPNAKLVVAEDVLSLEEGVSKTENWLQAHPDLKIICGITDSFAYGAYQAMAAAGCEGPEYGVFACDGAMEALDLISQGDTIYRGTIALTMVETSKECIDVIWDHWNGGELPEEMRWGMSAVTTAEMAAPFMVG